MRVGTHVAQHGTRPDGSSPDDPRFDLDPVVEVYKRDIDRTLVREQLRRSVDVRVRNMIAALRFAEALHEAGRRPTKP